MRALTGEAEGGIKSAAAAVRGWGPVPFEVTSACTSAGCLAPPAPLPARPPAAAAAAAAAAAKTKVEKRARKRFSVVFFFFPLSLFKPGENESAATLLEQNK